MDKIQKIKEHIAEQIKDSIENSEFWVTKSEVAQNSNVPTNTLYSILGAKTDYTIESLIKICIERNIHNIELWPQSLK